MITLRGFIKWVVAQEPASLFATFMIMFEAALWGYEFSLIPLPKNDQPIGWLDYWLNRYQTLVSGILAIVAGAFALLAARKAIAYDQTKTRDEQETNRRDSVKAIQNVVSYTSRAIFSKHLPISLSRSFPMDVIPTGFMDADPLEKILFDNLKSLPSNMAMRCLYITYAMKLQNSAMQNLAMAQDQPENPTFEQNFKAKLHYLREMEGLMFACEIVSRQLNMLASFPELKPEYLDWINQEMIDLLRRGREVPEKEIPHVLRDLNIRFAG